MKIHEVNVKSLTKVLLTMFFIALLLCIIPNVVSAYEDTFTTEDGIVVKKNIDGYQQGNVHFDITNIELNEEKNYKWGFSKSSNIESVEKWYGLNDVTASQKVASIDMLTSDSTMFKFLRENDSMYLYIKDAEDELVVNGLKVDLSLPISYAFKLSFDTNWSHYLYNVAYNGNDYNSPSIYKIKNVYYKFEKITDDNLIEKYRTALSNNDNMNNIIEKTQDDINNLTNWTLCDSNKYNTNLFVGFKKSTWPTEQGVYYLYLKGKDADTKTVYGALIVNIDSNGPTVKSIEVVSPKEGTYNTPQTVKIRAYFSEAITGTTMPTLKIKFGESPERSITEGTIHNESYYYYKYIEYSYNIQDGDKGQLITVGYEGGDIKDSSGNEAKLSCPLITGNAIKANTEGNITNNTDNQDKNNDQTTPTVPPTQNPNNQPTPTPNNPSNNGRDDTIANINLPNTGAGIIIITTLALLVVAGIVAYIKYNKYRDVQ